MEIYRIEDLVFTFPEQNREALSHISLTIHSGEFITIAGKSGCGKSTLLRQLKTILTPHGERSGNIYFRDTPINELDQRTQASEIGFVFQNPDNQIVTDKVWHELAFGLESLGYDPNTIRVRVAEMASFFGIHTWFHRHVTELSGGQKQLLNLASVMVMHPSVLILDEPTSQLDPIAAADFLATVRKINQELGTTIIMTEHRLEEVLPISDRLIILDGGTLVADDSPRKVGQILFRMNHPMFSSMPSPMQIQAGVDQAEVRDEGLLTVKEGRRWINGYLAGKQPALIPEKKTSPGVSGQIALEFKDVWFKYDRSGPDVLKGMSLKVSEGEFRCIVGGNGTGKSTALSLIGGIHQPYRGKVRIGGNNPAKMKPKELFTHYLGIVPQNPQALFVKKTVEQDLYEVLTHTTWSKSEQAAKAREMIEFAELEPLLNMHPYDLSGGEQQRVALAKVLLLEPKILVLDEPTKGLDYIFKEKFAALLKKLNRDGVTIIMVSHDIEFCARHGKTCSMFFDGSLMTTNHVIPFFSGNSFYTTAANRMARHIWSEGVTVESVIELCQRSR